MYRHVSNTAGAITSAPTQLSFTRNAPAMPCVSLSGGPRCANPPMPYVADAMR